MQMYTSLFLATNLVLIFACSDSMVTGPRPEGFYLGNDKHTLREVWQVKQEVQTFIATRADSERLPGTKDWYIKTSDKNEQSRQSRFRDRFRLVWAGIQTNAESLGVSEEDVVSKLQEIQDALKCGISRVETWARDAVKHKTSFLDQAKKYQEQVEARGARRPQNCVV